eukprot:1188933-Prorocentrum_minimum.AAC.1
MCSEVRPFFVLWNALPLYSRSFSVAGRWPMYVAQWRGVEPQSARAWMSAPHRCNRVITSTCCTGERLRTKTIKS